MPVSDALSTPSTVSLDQTDGLALTALYRAAIGSVHTDYYQSVFERFEITQRASWSWNWAAAALTLNWLIFRNLWGPALIYAGIWVAVPLLLGLGRLVFRWPSPVEYSVILICAVLSCVIPGGVGNAVLYAKSRHNMATALAETATLANACTVLAQQASSRRRLISLAFINGFVGSLVALVYFWAPLDMSAKAPVLPGLMPPHAAPPQPVTPVRASAASSPVLLPASAPVSMAAPVSAPITVPISAPISAPVPALIFAPILTAAPARVSASAVVAVPISTARPPATLPLPAVQAAPDTPQTKPPEPHEPHQARMPRSSNAAYVDVGLFSDAQNAHEVHAKLVAADLPAFIREVPSRRGNLIKVGAGPFDTRLKARQAIAKIRDLHLDAALARPKKAMIQQPSHATYVDVGLFADAQHAHEVHDKLVEADLPAFIKEVQTRQGTLIKVGAGPFETRLQAHEAITKISDFYLDAAVAKPTATLPLPAAQTASDTPPTQPPDPAQAGMPHSPEAAYVDVGLFAVAHNAHKVHARLVAADLPAFIKEVQTRRGTLIKVGAGPFDTRLQARQAITKIRDLHLDAALAKP